MNESGDHMTPDTDAPPVAATSDAEVDFYATPLLGLSVRAGRHGDVRLGYEADLGDDYTASNLRLRIQLYF